ncbi:MAG TPA: hypothetical protein VK620_33985 [Bradyrhizobium sp.]|jgi:hypothetical protein|nr:hypothetical protein [Bradyrhizobium sp.]
MQPRIEWQRYKIDRNSVHVLTRLTRSGKASSFVNGHTLYVDGGITTSL